MLRGLKIMKHFWFDNIKDTFTIKCLSLNVFSADSVEWNAFSKNYKSCSGVPTESWEKQIEEQQHWKSTWLMPYAHFTGLIWYKRPGDKEELGTMSVGALTWACVFTCPSLFIMYLRTELGSPSCCQESVANDLYKYWEPAWSDGIKVCCFTGGLLL